MITTENVIPGIAEIGKKDWLKRDDKRFYNEQLDHFIEKNGTYFAGFHLIADFWGCSDIDNLEQMEIAMRSAVEKAKATLLHIHLHHFSPNGGISGVAVLAESHISVHTWPECGYAAFDIFMCGDAKPHQAIEVLRCAFLPKKYNVDEIKRGIISEYQL